ncbi:MAG: radical SAM protein [Candidatus Omnitrophica bacterium]|nr:radical SAM protein [Candidatus Omnitrophota bacterium]
MMTHDIQKRQRFLLRMAGARDEKVYIGPEIVHLHINNYCNIRCQYCWYHAPDNPTSRHPLGVISFKKIKEIVRDCVDLKVDCLYLSGDGDPVFHPRFSDIMALLDKTPLSVTLFTNGAFPLKYCRDVKKADRVIINLAAVDRQSYQLLHGKDFFDRVIKNIQNLVLLREIQKPSLKIEIVFVMNTLNAHLKGKMQALAKRLRVDNLAITPMQPHDYNQDLILDKKQKTEKSPEAAARRLPCFQGWFYVTQNFDGRVSVCRRVYEMEIANIKKVSFREAWLSKKFMVMRLAGKRGLLPEKYDSCRYCQPSQRDIEIAKKMFARRKYE